MIKYKVGIGGHYTDWADAWTALCGLDPLTDDYEFEQISSFTINNWPNMGLAANYVNLNGYSVKFYCKFENAHQGNPTKGYITSLSGANGIIDMRFSNTNVARYNVYIENLYIRQITNNDNLLFRVQSSAAGGGNALNVNVKNIMIEGFSNLVSIGIYCIHQDDWYRFSNIKIWNVKQGFDGTPGSFGGLVPSDRATNSIFENMSVYNTSMGLNWGGIHTGSTVASALVRGKTFINCVSCANTSNYSWWHTNNAKYLLYNCADDDNRIVTGGGLAYNCQANIVEANEFESLLDTNPEFLNLSKGYLNVTANFVPTKGQAPLRIQFNPDVEYKYRTGLLLPVNGIAPILSIEDISGMQYGKYGDYPIGCHNAEITYS